VDEAEMDRCKTEETLRGPVMHGTPLIRLTDVSKVYHLESGDFPALNHISLDISEGEFVALMGPSGSGKSTMMNQLGILDVPTTGEIYVAGKNIARMTNLERTHMRRDVIGYVFQKFYLIPLLSAYENVEYPLILKYKKRDITGRAAAVLKSVGFDEELSAHRPNQLSGGQQQRVAIARALVNDPKILLCDEPTGNLDRKTGFQIMDILVGLHKEGKTVILVTHDPKIAEYAHRTIQLEDGRVVES
jgi:putative ABC transport system ATP-binding protein